MSDRAAELQDWRLWGAGPKGLCAGSTGDRHIAVAGACRPSVTAPLLVTIEKVERVLPFR